MSTEKEKGPPNKNTVHLQFKVGKDGIPVPVSGNGGGGGAPSKQVGKSNDGPAPVHLQFSVGKDGAVTPISGGGGGGGGGTAKMARKSGSGQTKTAEKSPKMARKSGGGGGSPAETAKINAIIRFKPPGQQQLKLSNLKPVSMTDSQTVLANMGSIQDIYCRLKFSDENLKIPDSRNQLEDDKGQQKSKEYLLYYKMGYMFVRPMGVFNGVINKEFHKIIPYVMRRSNGELAWLVYSSQDPTMRSDHEHVLESNVAAKFTSSVMITVANEQSQVFVFGEMYRGFSFSAPSILELKGRLFMTKMSADGLVEHQIKPNCIIEVQKASLVVFICDFCHIVILPDWECELVVKFISESESNKNAVTKKLQINGKQQYMAKKSDSLSEIFTMIKPQSDSGGKGSSKFTVKSGSKRGLRGKSVGGRDRKKPRSSGGGGGSSHKKSKSAKSLKGPPPPGPDSGHKKPSSLKTLSGRVKRKSSKLCGQKKRTSKSSLNKNSKRSPEVNVTVTNTQHQQVPVQVLVKAFEEKGKMSSAAGPKSLTGMEKGIGSPPSGKVVSIQIPIKTLIKEFEKKIAGTPPLKVSSQKSLKDGKSLKQKQPPPPPPPPLPPPPKSPSGKGGGGGGGAGGTKAKLKTSKSRLTVAGGGGGGGKKRGKKSAKGGGGSPESGRSSGSSTGSKPSRKTPLGKLRSGVKKFKKRTSARATKKDPPEKLAQTLGSIIKNLQEVIRNSSLKPNVKAELEKTLQTLQQVKPPLTPENISQARMAASKIGDLLEFFKK